MELYTHCLPALLLPLSAAVFSAVRGFDVVKCVGSLVEKIVEDSELQK